MGIVALLADIARLTLAAARRHGLPLLFWLGCAIGLGGGAALYLRGAEQAAEQQAYTQAEGAAETLEQLVLRIFEAVETLHELAQSRQTLLDEGNQAGARAVEEHLARVAGQGRFAVIQMASIGANGWMDWTSEPGSERVFLGDRPHFRAHLGNNGETGLYLSQPMLGRVSGRWAVQASRPLRHAAGGFAGVSVVSLDPLLLSRLIGEQGPMAGLQFQLRRLPEGGLLARSAEPSGFLRAAPEPTHPAVQAATMQRQGRLRQAQALLAFRAPPGVPLVAMAVVDTHLALAEFRHWRGLVLLGLGVVLLAGLLLAVLLTLNHALRARLADEAVRDPVTGLFNRRHLTEALCRALGIAARDSGLAGLLVLGLDRFAEVNETLGHEAGDALLCALAQRLRATLREGDTLVRLGGDSFAILQHNPREAADAAALAGRLQAMLVQPFALPEHPTTVSASIGIALGPLDGATAETLIRNAEIALYRAKSEGRGSHRFFEPAMDAAMQARRALELGLRDALAKQELELHYQPLFDLRHWRVSGFEALLRWRRPGIGLVSPAEFIPVAEETGLITPIGEWVLRQACADAAGWPADVKVAVNLSPVQFRHGHAVPAVAAALAASGLRPNRLELEITEGVLLHDSAETCEALAALRALGARVALDDFGAGYSSLTYLLRFPFDKVKIDRGFIADLGSGAGAGANRGAADSLVIVRAIIGMCRNLNIAVTAEGVETEEQLRRLSQEGCTEAQGYLFSRPRPAAEVPAMLAEPGQKLARAAA